mgnify:CR=1 FL=1
MKFDDADDDDDRLENNKHHLRTIASDQLRRSSTALGFDEC